MRSVDIWLYGKPEVRVATLAKPCLIWQRSCNKVTGYGQLSVKYKSGRRTVLTPHRVAWKLTYGSTHGKSVLHHCDQRACFEPTHLFLGTHDDNMRDMSRKGRAAKTLLTPTQVMEIREALSRVDVTQAALARHYGVSAPTINDIVKGRSWS